MILSFSSDQFKDKILNGEKVHTIRTDRSERWKKGQKIHFWRGNPRNTKAKPKPHQFHEGSCCSVQKIEIDFIDEGYLPIKVVVDNNLLTPDQVNLLAIRDGFNDLAEMVNWFKDVAPNGFKGRLIHWTKLKY